MIVLYVQNCTTNVHYRTIFQGDKAESRAISFIESRKMTHVIYEDEEFPISPSFRDLLDKLYPTCEHGMSLSLCMGPEHYPTREQEMMMEI